MPLNKEIKPKLLVLSRKNFDLFCYSGVICIFFEWNFSINLNFRSNFLKSLLNSPRLLLGVGQNFTSSLKKKQADFCPISMLMN